MHTLIPRKACTRVFFILTLGVSVALTATARAQAPQDRSVLPPPAPTFQGKRLLWIERKLAGH